MKKPLLMLAHYNKWANEKLYDAVGQQDEDVFGRDLSGFFGSIGGALNHILVGDMIWMRRFTGEGRQPAALDEVLYDSFQPLWQARQQFDQKIIEWIDTSSEDTLSGRFMYMTVTDMRRVSQNLTPALYHFFNHQTHHRGQVHQMLSQIGATPPSLDLIQFQREPEGRSFS